MIKPKQYEGQQMKGTAEVVLETVCMGDIEIGLSPGGQRLCAIRLMDGTPAETWANAHRIRDLWNAAGDQSAEVVQAATKMKAALEKFVAVNSDEELYEALKAARAILKEIES